MTFAETTDDDSSAMAHSHLGVAFPVRTKSSSGERSGILAAYLFPSANGLWPAATPVNAWRLLMNEVLGTALDRVEDRSYYSPWARPYDFVEVADRPLTPPSAHAQ